MRWQNTVIYVYLGIIVIVIAIGERFKLTAINIVWCGLMLNVWCMWAAETYILSGIEWKRILYGAAPNSVVISIKSPMKYYCFAEALSYSVLGLGHASNFMLTIELYGSSRYAGAPVWFRPPPHGTLIKYRTMDQFNYGYYASGLDRYAVRTHRTPANAEKLLPRPTDRDSIYQISHSAPYWNIQKRYFFFVRLFHPGWMGIQFAGVIFI